MSSHDENRRRACGADVAAYALGALEPAEADAFRRHLEGCSVCAHELASLRRVVDELPLTTTRYQASSELRGRVLRAIATTPDAGDRFDRSRRPHRTRRSVLSLSSWHLSPRAIAAASSAAVITAAVVIVLVLSLSTGSSTRTITAHVTGPGHAALRVVDGRGELVVHGLPAPPPGKIYEVWVQRDQRVRPTSALFSVTTRGDGVVGVPGSMHGVGRIMVTAEPAGGSRVPTQSPVIVATLG